MGKGFEGREEERFRACSRGSLHCRAGLKSLFQKSVLSENWGFWIPAFAGMTDLGAIFHALVHKFVEKRLVILSINLGKDC